MTVRHHCAICGALGHSASTCGADGTSPELFRCALRNSHGLPCGALKRMGEMVGHLAEAHGLRVSAEAARESFTAAVWHKGQERLSYRAPGRR